MVFHGSLETMRIIEYELQQPELALFDYRSREGLAIATDTLAATRGYAPEIELTGSDQARRALIPGVPFEYIPDSCLPQLSVREYQLGYRVDVKAPNLVTTEGGGSYATLSRMVYGTSATRRGSSEYFGVWLECASLVQWPSFDADGKPDTMYYPPKEALAADDLAASVSGFITMLLTEVAPEGLQLHTRPKCVPEQSTIS